MSILSEITEVQTIVYGARRQQRISPYSLVENGRKIGFVRKNLDKD